MKPFTIIALSSILAFAAASAALLHAQSTPWTTTTEAELVSPGDFDGDGILDVLIVDRSLGVVRLGWGQADGGLEWSDVRSLALENVGSLAVGHIQNIARDSFVVTGPDWNSTYLYPGTRDANWTARVMTPPVFAPGALAAVDVGGTANNPLLADLFVAGGDFDPGTGEVRSASVLPGALILVGQSVIGAPQQHGHAASLTPKPQAATFSVVSPTETILTFWSNLDTAPAPGLPVVSGLPAGADFIQTPLGVGQATLFIFTPGQAVLIRQPLATATTLGAQTLHDLGQPIDFVVGLQTASLQPRLLVSFAGGTAASAYSLDGDGAPVLMKTFIPAAGSRFTAAASASTGGALQLFTGLSSGGGTMGWQRWNFNDTTFTAGPSGVLPVVSPLAARRNVFFFSQEIFIEPTATLLASLKAGDWSTSVSAGSPVNALASEFLGSTQGLGLEEAYPLGARPSGGSFGIPNQYASDISLSRLAASGPPPPLGMVTFAPPSGHYESGTSLYLIPPRPDDIILYRQAQTGSWISYAGPITLPASGLNLEAIARPLGTTQSTPTARATYLSVIPPPMTAPPGSDANANGLSDPWEDAFGLTDPTADTDHDNATNKQEHDAGTDPTNPADSPTPSTVTIFDNIEGIFNGNLGASTTSWRAAKLCLKQQPYQLDSISMPLSIFDLNIHKSSVRLRIFSNDPAKDRPSSDTGVPMNLSGMTNPITSTQINNGTLVIWTPATPFTLAANTCYWAVLDVESGAVVNLAASQTTPTGDASAKWYTYSTDSGATWGEPSNFATHKMLIRGTPVPAPQELHISEFSTSGNSLQIGFLAIAGRTYVVETRVDVTTGVWTTVPGTTSAGTGNILRVILPNTTTTLQQYFRVKQLP